MKIHANVFDRKPVPSLEGMVGEVMARVVRAEGHRPGMPSAVHPAAAVDAWKRSRRETKAIALYEQGATLRDIGKALGGITASAAMRHMERMIAKGRVQRRDISGGQRRKFDHELICDLRKQGLTFDAIAAQVGCSASHACDVCKMYE